VSKRPRRRSLPKVPYYGLEKGHELREEVNAFEEMIMQGIGQILFNSGLMINELGTFRFQGFKKKYKFLHYLVATLFEYYKGFVSKKETEKRLKTLLFKIVMHKKSLMNSSARKRDSMELLNFIAEFGGGEILDDDPRVYDIVIADIISAIDEIKEENEIKRLMNSNAP